MGSSFFPLVSFLPSYLGQDTERHSYLQNVHLMLASTLDEAMADLLTGNSYVFSRARLKVKSLNPYFCNAGPNMSTKGCPRNCRFPLIYSLDGGVYKECLHRDLVEGLSGDNDCLLS